MTTTGKSICFGPTKRQFLRHPLTFGPPTQSEPLCPSARPKVHPLLPLCVISIILSLYAIYCPVSPSLPIIVIYGSLRKRPNTSISEWSSVHVRLPTKTRGGSPLSKCPFCGHCDPRLQNYLATWPSGTPGLQEPHAFHVCTHREEKTREQLMAVPTSQSAR